MHAQRLRDARAELVGLHEHRHERRDVVHAGAVREVPERVPARAAGAQLEIDEAQLVGQIRVCECELFADALDLLVVSVEAGLGLDQALTRVGQELAFAYPELSDELRLINLELRAGKPRPEALRNLADRTGVDDLSSLVTMLIQTDKFGTSVAQSLRVYSDTLRTKRRQRAEEAAAKIALKLLFPLIFCIFPSLLLVLLGPAFIQIYRVLLPALGGNR